MSSLITKMQRTCRLRFSVLWRGAILVVFLLVTCVHYWMGGNFLGRGIGDSSLGERKTLNGVTEENRSKTVIVEHTHIGKESSKNVHVHNLSEIKSRHDSKLNNMGNALVTKQKPVDRGPSYVTENPSKFHFSGEPDNTKMLILQYTEFYHTLKPGGESFAKCEYSQCEWTTDHDRLNQSHVVLFHMWGGVLRKLGLPKKHPLWQKWMFFTKEAPTRYKFNTWSPMLGAVYHLDLPHLNGAFNMTMTFMSDSDVTFPYGRVKKRETPQKITTNFAAGKTGQVAWVVSHCKTASGREDLVKELQKYVKVDIYGRCGPFDCPDNCFSYLGKKYKFYLALENSDCDDYISEKFWFNSFSYKMVPIVRGRRSNYKNLAPAHSYIHWDDYSIEELANLIKTLDKNDKLYNEYFDWRNGYVIDNMSNWMCDLCENLHKNKRTVKYYTNIENYWDASTRCKL